MMPGGGSYQAAMRKREGIERRKSPQSGRPTACCGREGSIAVVSGWSDPQRLPRRQRPWHGDKSGVLEPREIQAVSLKQVLWRATSDLGELKREQAVKSENALDTDWKSDWPVRE